MVSRPLTDKNSILVTCGFCQEDFRMLRLRFNERKKRNEDYIPYCCVEHSYLGRGESISKGRVEGAWESGARLITNCFTCSKEVEIIKFNLKERNFCSNACCLEFMAEQNRKKPSPDPLEKWLASVDQTPGLGPTGECWIWTGSYRDFEGLEEPYGQFHWPRLRVMGAHVAAYSLYTGDMNTRGFEICHTCDHPACVNPAHLFKGTGQDNQQDCLKKLRKPIGAKAPTAKLTEAQVLEIRKLRVEGMTCRAIAQQYDVHESTIARAARGITFYHLYGDS